ncbi:hypothetical protein MKEN_01325100 [Mycena kentingensis (nom. inval.)]|nr:hypothetical protein MKEN_01325100 [Mycena kentingensis (nom. inval.)]
MAAVLSVEDILSRMEARLAAANAKKAKLMTELEKANRREPNDAAMDVLKSRQKLSEEVAEMKVQVAEAINAQCSPAEISETLKLLQQTQMVAIEIEDLKPKERRLERKERPKNPVERIADAIPSTSTFAPPQPVLPPRLARVARDPSPAPAPAPTRPPIIDWDNYPLQRPPGGYANWNDFYEGEGLAELARAQARVKRGDPLLVSTARSGYGVVVVQDPPCQRCVKKGYPCLFVDPSTIKTPTLRCLVCRESDAPCQESKPRTPGHKYVAAVAAYHNTTSTRGERPGVWMGPGVPDLDILPARLWETVMTGRGTRNSRASGTM